MTSLPEGLTIGVKYKWKIGALLGRGACGSVHALEPVSQTHSPLERSYVIKIARGSRSKSKGKGNAERRNADTIHYEHTLIKNRLPSLCGEYIPNLPSWGKKYPPSGGTITEGNLTYEYLVLERLPSSLMEWAPFIDGIRLSFGKIAVKMLECIEKLHKEKLLHVDVKPENFMVAHPLPSAGEMRSSQTDFSNSVRLIDFGLSEDFRSFGGTFGHRPNVTTKGLVGTPLYASCHVMKNETPSRRDDLESLGYVLLDLFLMIKDRVTESRLPWRSGVTSDKEILIRKEHFFRSRGEGLMDSSDGQIVMRYFDVVRQLTYKKEPDYKQLKVILGALHGGCHPIAGEQNSLHDFLTIVTDTSLHDHHTKISSVISMESSLAETEFFDSAEELSEENGASSDNDVTSSPSMDTPEVDEVNEIDSIRITGGVYKGRLAFPTGKTTKQKVTVRLDSQFGKEVTIFKTSLGLQIGISSDGIASPRQLECSREITNAITGVSSGEIQERIVKGGLYKGRKGFFQRATNQMVYIHLDSPDGELKRISKANWE